MPRRFANVDNDEKDLYIFISPPQAGLLIAAFLFKCIYFIRLRLQILNAAVTEPCC